MAGGNAPTWIRTPPGDSGPPSWRGPASWRISWLTELTPAIHQYVILGAGLDTFAQRNPSAGSYLRVFEIDQPATQAWKRQRLADLGYDIPDWLHFVPVDFEAGASWRDQLVDSDFDSAEPAIIASTGVSMYLTGDAVAATLRQVCGTGTGLDVGHVVPPALGIARHRRGTDGAGRRTRALGPRAPRG